MTSATLAVLRLAIPFAFLGSLNPRMTVGSIVGEPFAIHKTHQSASLA